MVPSYSNVGLMAVGLKDSQQKPSRIIQIASKGGDLITRGDFVVSDIADRQREHNPVRKRHLALRNALHSCEHCTSSLYDYPKQLLNLKK